MIKTIDFSSEFIFSASRSSGAGGQNVNKVNTKVEVRFCIPESDLIDEKEKNILLEKLGNKINLLQEIIVVSQSERTQLGNKKKVAERLNNLLNKALLPRKKRKPTSPTKASKLKRIETKRHKSEQKSLRKKIDADHN